MRAYARSFIALLVVLATASACAETSGTGDGDQVAWPAGADQLVLRIDSCCGYVPVDYSLTQVPQFSLFGHGQATVPGPQIEIYPSPALPNIQAFEITDEAIGQILGKARAAGLYEDHEWTGSGAIADAATTIFTLVEGDGTTHVTKVYALSEDTSYDPNMSEEERRARARLSRFQEQIGRMREWLPEGSVGEEHEYSFDSMRVYSRTYTSSDESPELKQPEKAWPLYEPLATFGAPVRNLDGYRCGVVEGPDLDKLLPDVKESNQLTPWTSEDDRYRLYFRPLLPDESGC